MRRLIFKLLILITITTCPLHAAEIAVIGTGNVGQALGVAFAAQGHRITYGSRNPDGDDVARLVAASGDKARALSPAAAAADADIVVLAVPGMLAVGISEDLGDLSGKIIIDPTNPLTGAPGRFVHGVDSSNAELIQAAAPASHVVKAFNTVTWQAMADPSSAGGPISVPLLSNSESAKRTVAELAAAIGLEPIDLGGLEAARGLEIFAVAYVNSLIRPDLPNFEIHLRRMAND